MIYQYGENREKRVMGTVRLSRDEGGSWETIKIIEEGSFSYSCLSILPDGEIGLFYEADGSSRMVFVKFPLDV
jgi:sialidase-1